MKDKGEKTGFRFDRMELAGSLGDLGTLIPLAAGMIVFNKLSPSSVLLWVGIFYVLAGAYYRLPVPVQPLKVVGALAIASPAAITEPVIAAAGMTFGVILLVLSFTGAMKAISTVFTRPVVRGIQLGLGIILMKKGFDLLAAPEVFLEGEKMSFYGVPVNIVLGVAVFVMVFVLLNNRRMPAALAALVVGVAGGLALGGLSGVSFALGPERLPLLIPGTESFPSFEQFASAMLLLVIPQLPLTIGNAAIGTADTACSLFPESPEIERATPGRFAATMGLINIPAGLMAAMPMCHGAGGLAAHYRFGARTGGSNLMIGAVCLVLALAFGKLALSLLIMIPQSVLGVLLAFAGIELALLVRDLKERHELFVTVLVAGIAVAGTNMAYAFIAGILADLLIRKARVKV
ncbi:MAG: putative sulfate/molybdate transporter [bacterium]